MAMRRGFWGMPVEEDDALPVIVRTRDGEIDEEATRRINANNKLFQRASENESFTIGRFANELMKLIDERTARVIRAAQKTRTRQKEKFDKEGVPAGVFQLFGKDKIQEQRKGGRIKSTIRKSSKLHKGGALLFGMKK